MPFTILQYPKALTSIGDASMSIYYLYLKTHNRTGLKYLGKTNKKDPYAYKGSGKYWKLHIKKHGYDVTTEILLESDNVYDIQKAGLYYSNKWDIVKSKEFANMIPENGTGGFSACSFSDETKKKLSKSTKKYIKNLAENDWHKEGPLNKSKGHKWWNNGINQMRATQCPGKDWNRGMLSHAKK